MEIYSFPVTVNRAEALLEAEKRQAKILGKLFTRGSMSRLQLHYIEYKLITLQVILRGRARIALPGRKEKYMERADRLKRICVIGNGSTGGVMYVMDHPKLEVIDADEIDYLQESDYSEEQLVKSAKKLGMRVIHRMLGGIPMIEVLEVKRVYRPFWVAFYGSYEMGNRVRYITMAADGCSSRRDR